ncbi:hypothetical protein AA21952_1091 [Acetobacter oeni LMG 21952]|nr:hypothetical protein AA21952_1091 [Acetobacter oeni LMG 21952]
MIVSDLGTHVGIVVDLAIGDHGGGAGMNGLVTPFEIYDRQAGMDKIGADEAFDSDAVRATMGER